MALFPVIDGQVQFDPSVPSGSIYRNGLRYSPDGAVFAALDGQISNYSQGIGLTADGAVVITGNASIVEWQNGLPRDVESGAIFVTAGDALTYASGLPFTAQGALAISSDAPVPTLVFLFAGATELDPRVDFTRGSEATGWVNGQLETFGIDEPRFVTDPATGYSGLLLEPFASTNLLLNSDVVVDQTIIVPSGDITLSFYGEGEVSFTGAATGTLQGAGGNARAEITVTATAGALVLSVTDGAPILGQLEEGTKATSYIPTEDSQVTRAADSDVVLHGQSFKDVFNPHSGALIIDVMSRHTTGLGSRAKVFGLGDGDYNNVQSNSMYLSQSHDGRYTLRRGTAALGSNISLGPRIRLGLRWEDGVLSIFVDGVLLTDSVDISGIDMNEFTELSLGGEGYTAAFSTSIYRNFQLYSGYLSDAQLAALTEL